MSSFKTYHLKQLMKLRDEIKQALPKQEQRRLEDLRQARTDWYVWREAMKEAGVQQRLWR
jgi:hypothetical protein